MHNLFIMRLPPWPPRDEGYRIAYDSVALDRNIALWHRCGSSVDAVAVGGASSGSLYFAAPCDSLLLRPRPACTSSYTVYSQDGAWQADRIMRHVGARQGLLWPPMLELTSDRSIFIVSQHGSSRRCHGGSIRTIVGPMGLVDSTYENSCWCSGSHHHDLHRVAPGHGVPSLWWAASVSYKRIGRVI